MLLILAIACGCMALSTDDQPRRFWAYAALGMFIGAVVDWLAL